MSTTSSPFKKKFLVKLSTEQIADRGKEMAQLSDRRKALKKERREAMAEFKQRLAGIDERDEALALAVNEGKEHIEVEVVRQADLARNCWVYVATADSHVMAEEPMTLVEIAEVKEGKKRHQGDLPLRSGEVGGDEDDDEDEGDDEGDGRAPLTVMQGGKVVAFSPPALVDGEGYVAAGGGEPLPEGATFEETPAAPAAEEPLPEGLPGWVTATRNDAGAWPLCPSCGGDTLRSAAVPPNAHRIVDCNTCGWKPPIEQEKPAGEAPAGDAAATPTGDAAAPAAKAKREIACPALVAKHDTDPRLDDICGGAGAGRRKGFCSDCYSKLGGAKGSPEMIEALKRRKEREKLEHDAAASARKEASKVGDVSAAAATASFTE